MSLLYRHSFMMPFIELTTIHLGPIPIQPFGLLVALGVFFGTGLSARYASRFKLSEDKLRYVGIRVIVFGFITCHLLDVFFYTPGKVLDDPLVIFRVWEGIASYGGILGAVIAFSYYAKRMDMHYLRYGDAVVYGFSVGLMFGRIGCATAHDHLGRVTDFWGGVTLPALNRCPELTREVARETRGCFNWRLPDGTSAVTAHDLGLYEMFILLGIFLILSLVIKFWTTRRPGTLIAICAFTYPPIRFFLEFLRFPDSDPRYWGLTPAQHLCLWTIVGGILVVRAMRKPENQSLFGDELDEVPEASASEPSKPAKLKAKAKVVRKKKK